MVMTNRSNEPNSFPSERDWGVYQAVHIKQWPTRSVAAEFEISQTRVCQIAERTAAFIAQGVSVLAKEDEPRQLAAGKQLAADRIEFLYGEAVRSFRLSQHQEDDGSGRRANNGDARFLQAAARLAILASTLPPPRSMWPTEPANQPAAPDQLQETCSAAPVEQQEEAPPNTAAVAATVAAMVGCVEQARTIHRARETMRALFKSRVPAC